MKPPIFFRAIGAFSLVLSIILLLLLAVVIANFFEKGMSIDFPQALLLACISYSSVWLIAASISWLFDFKSSYNFLYSTFTFLTLFTLSAIFIYFDSRIYTKGSNYSIIFFSAITLLFILSLFSLMGIFFKAVRTWVKEHPQSSKVKFSKTFFSIYIISILTFPLCVYFLIENSTSSYSLGETRHSEDLEITDTIDASAEDEDYAYDSEEDDVIIDPQNINLSHISMKDRPLSKESLEELLARIKNLGFYTDSIVEVYNILSLVTSIRSNTTILLHSGNYVFSNKDFRRFKFLNKNYQIGSFYGITNLTIIGFGDSTPVVLAEDLFSTVLGFDKSKNIFISNIIMGHLKTTNNECDAAVFRSWESKKVRIENSVLFGCGESFPCYVTSKTKNFHSSLLLLLL